MDLSFVKDGADLSHTNQHLFPILVLSFAICVGVRGAGARTNRFRADLPAPRLLPGQSDFAFTLYGAPGNVGELKEVVAVMREKHLGNGFDPGPAAVASSRPLLEYLATVGWPVIYYPPDGGRMQVKGGTSVLNNADEEALRILDRAGVFSAIQLGEWGYHFHRLQSDEGWWKAVLGTDFEAKAKDFAKPAAQRGYDPLPRSRRECYDQLREYFLWHRQTKGGRLISVTGHSHYELVTAAEGGSRILLHPRHVEALGPELFGKLKKAGAVEVLDAWENPETKRLAAISRERLRQIEQDALPIGVDGDPVQYQLNRNQTGWVIELINNDGVVKEGRKPATIHPEVIARVKLTPRFP